MKSSQPNFFDLHSRVALVTGAGQGLGRAIAVRLARAGARVAVNDLVDDRAEEVAGSIRAEGYEAAAIPADASSPGAVADIFERCDAELGEVSILVNNAGVAAAEDIFDTDFSSWEHVLRINLSGPFLCSKEALARMRRHGRGGRIIMVGSVVGHQGAVKGWPHYGATKSGLHGLAKTLSRTGASFGVTVNVVAPGVILTDMLQQSHGVDGVAELARSIPIGRLGDPEDVAAAVHFLASDCASFITGAAIDVNGGMYVRA